MTRVYEPGHEKLDPDRMRLAGRGRACSGNARGVARAEAAEDA
jgi:hypothetical protein